MCTNTLVGWKNGKSAVTDILCTIDDDDGFTVVSWLLLLVMLNIHSSFLLLHKYLMS